LVDGSADAATGAGAELASLAVDAADA